MGTLVMVELDPEDDTAPTLLHFIGEMLRVRYPHEQCVVKRRSPGNIQHKFDLMSEEIIKRAQSLLATDTSATRCAYVAPREMMFPRNDQEGHYPLETITMVVVDKDKVIGAYFIAHSDEVGTMPKGAVAILREGLLHMRESIHSVTSSEAEKTAADQLTDVILEAFGEASAYLFADQARNKRSGGAAGRPSLLTCLWIARFIAI